jgi:ATP-dependent RNA circularization protein (DNA/RNA ligase family)
MTEKFFRFPHTSHIAWMGQGSPRDDKVLDLSEASCLLRDPIIVEEKVDGANLGFSIDPNGNIRAQNRGQYLQPPFMGQFSRLNAWLANHECALLDALGENLILFGEWTAASHSITYDRLPDFFLVFDVYDRTANGFWSTVRRDRLAAGLDLSVIRSFGAGIYSLSQLKRMVQDVQSSYREGPCEGLYLRWQDTSWLTMRAKLVRADFVQTIQSHWRSRKLVWNKVTTSSLLL